MVESEKITQKAEKKSVKSNSKNEYVRPYRLITKGYERLKKKNANQAKEYDVPSFLYLFVIAKAEFKDLKNDEYFKAFAEIMDLQYTKIDHLRYDHEKFMEDEARCFKKQSRIDKWSKVDLFKDTCSSTCYKIIVDYDLPSIDELTYDVDWRVSHEFEVKRLIRRYGKDYCKIAKDINQKCYLVARFSHRFDVPEPEIMPPAKRAKKEENRNNMMKMNYLARVANHESLKSKFYSPCNHPNESCQSAKCSCFEGNLFCEELCGCSRDCVNKFPGCQACSASCDSNKCPCFLASRECTSLCRKCTKTTKDVRCKNLYTQINVPKKLQVQQSKLKNAGNGCFALEPIKKDEFVIEYTGEMIDNPTVVKRDLMYKKIKRSYIFELSLDYSIDAFFCGNESRFINHDETRPNCYVKIITINGEKRILFFATKDINEGEELFFNYKYENEIKQAFF
jgi:hypothetical protein